MPHLPTPPPSTSSSRSPSQTRNSQYPPTSSQYSYSQQASAMATQDPQAVPQSYYKPDDNHTPSYTPTRDASTTVYTPDAYTARYSSHSPVQPPSPPSSLSSSSYAGSEAEHQSIDPIAVLRQRLDETFSTLPLDRTIAIQAQTSGLLNGTNVELMETRKYAAARLIQMRRITSDGLKTADELKKNLQKMGDLANGLSRRVEQRYPGQYQEARARIDPRD